MYNFKISIFGHAYYFERAPPLFRSPLIMFYDASRWYEEVKNIFWSELEKLGEVESHDTWNIIMVNILNPKMITIHILD